MSKLTRLRIAAFTIFFIPFIALNAQELMIIEVTSTPVSCGGASDGSITVSITGGIAPYQYGLFVGLTPIASSPIISDTTYTFSGLSKYKFYSVIVLDSEGSNDGYNNVAVGGPNPIVITSYESTDITCNGFNDGTITVTATGEDGNFIFDLTGPVTDQNTTGYFDNLPEGVNYRVTVSHDGSCPSEDKTPLIRIENPPLISITLDDITDANCFGSFTGSISITPSGGTPSGSGTGYTYAWTGPNGFTSTDEDITNLESGNYNVSVYDGNLCVGNGGSYFVDEPPEITVTLDGSTDVTCPGDNDGSASITVAGGTPAYTISWDGQGTGFNSSVEDPVNLVADTYDLTITDDNGCIKVFSGIVTIDEPLPITVNVDGTTDVTCFGGTDGAALISTSGGTAGYTYLWSGATSGYSSADEDPVNMPADVYSLTVTDAAGCSEIFPNLLTITEPNDVLITVDGITDVLCNGGSDGSISISVTGGTPVYSFLWTGDNTGHNSTDEDPIGLPADTYDLVITDNHTCVYNFNDVATVNEPGLISVVVDNITNVNCFGDATGAIEITPAGGTPPFTFAWTGPDGFNSADEDISNLTAGSYSVTITDAAGCSNNFTDLATVNESPEIVSTFVLTHVSCNGLTDGAIDATVTGGNSPYSFSWTGPSGFTAGTEDISLLQAGDYELTVTDNLGCEMIFPIQTLIEPDPIIAVPDITDSDCFGANAGAINLTVTGGTAPYTFVWTGPNGYNSFDEDIINLEPGDYSVTVTDAAGCSEIFTNIATVNEPTEILVTPLKTDISCNGLTDGSISITISGGTAPYLFSWTGPGSYTSNQQDISDLGAGNYSLTITDGNGCVVNFIDIVTIIEPPAIIATFVSKTDVTCTGGNNGSIEINVSGGTAPLIFNWTSSAGDPVSTDEDPVGLFAETYSLTITDGNGCTADFPDLATITEPPLLTMSLSATNIICFGDGNGEIIVSAAGGVAPYEYSINGDIDANYQSSNTFSDLGPGLYTIWTRDANLCTVFDTISILEPEEIQILAESKTDVQLCFGDSSGQISIDDVTGGVMPYEYSINGGTDFYTTSVFTNLPAGSYQTVVRDANNCQVSGNLNVILQPSPIIIDSYIPVDVSTCFDSPEGEILITGAGGTGQLSYTLDSTITNQTGDFKNILAGTHTITIQDINGCTKDTTVIIAGPPPIVVDNANVTDVMNCAGDATGALNVSGSGGTGDLSYSINGTDWQSNGIFTGLIAGSYTVFLKDENDCSIDTLLTINEPAALTIESENATNITCNGLNDGAIVISVSGGTEPYTFTLNPGAITNNDGLFTGLAPGDYTFEVTDAYNCGPVPGSLITLTEPSALLIDSITDVDISCNGYDNGEIQIYASGGTPPYEFSVDNKTSFQTDSFFTDLPPEVYEVYVRDSNGCEAYGGSITLSEPLELTLDITVTDVGRCFGDSTGAISIIATGGTGNKLFSIDGIVYQLSGEFLNLPGGNYTVFAEDESGCSVNEPVTINEPEPIVATIEKTDATYGNLGSITISGATGGTSPYEYSINGPAGPFSSETFYDSLEAGTYFVIIRDLNGCTMDSLVEILDVVLLEMEIDYSDVSCFGEIDGMIEFRPQNAAGTVSYSIDNGITWVDTSLFENLPGNVTYYLLATDEEGKFFSDSIFISEPTEISIMRNIKPANCNAFSETGFIKLTSVTGGTGTYTYHWSNDSTTRDLINIVAGKYTVEVTDENGCVVTKEYTVNANVIVTAEAGADTSICQGTDLQLEGIGGSLVNWSPSTYLDDPNTPYPMASGISEDISYVLTVYEEISPYGCYNVDTINISILENKGIETTQDTVIMRGGSIQLNVTGGPFESYLWEPAAGLDDPSIPDPVASPSVSVIYIVTAINEYGCEERDSTFIEVIENLKVYNVFSPNGDGKNDFFDIESASSFPDMIVEVYSRWGDLLFSSKGYSDDKRWNGRSRGKDVPVGTYYYVIIPFSGAKPVTGNVTIIR